MERGKQYGAIVLIVLAILIALGLVYRNQIASMGGTRYGVVAMDTVVKANPHYEEYAAAEAKYAQMQSQYEQELQERLAKDGQYEQAMTEAMDTSGINLSLQKLYEAKMNLRRIQLNGELEEAYRLLLEEYAKEMGPEKKVNLEIVNLQLALQSLSFYTEEERAQKEQQLHILLEASDPSLLENNAWLYEKVMRAMIPRQEAAIKAMQTYEESLVQELRKEGEERVQKALLLTHQQFANPHAQIWQEAWQLKLEAQKTIVDRLYAQIEEDIVERAAVIAKKEKLSVIVKKYEYGGGAVDITEAIMDSYR